MTSRREYTVEVAINSHGLRDPERGYETPAGTARILALGDSFVEGYSVSLPETATQVLESALGRAGCPAEVINGGTAGYSTDQELLFYETEGHRYKPRVVVLFFQATLAKRVRSACPHGPCCGLSVTAQGKGRAAEAEISSQAS